MSYLECLLLDQALQRLESGSSNFEYCMNDLHILINDRWKGKLQYDNSTYHNFIGIHINNIISLQSHQDCAHSLKSF